MSAPDRYQLRRDKDRLGVWEHRGKVAVAGVGHSPVDRRWDGLSIDKRLGAYSILAYATTAILPAAAAAPRRGQQAGCRRRSVQKRKLFPAVLLQHQPQLCQPGFGT